MLTGNILLSVITITYNNYEELVRTLESLPAGNIIESVVINGGSCKKTLDLLSVYNGVVISEPDEGIADAFNKGIRNSHGEYILFLNSGDILLDQTYPEKALSIMESNKDVSFIHSNMILDDPIGGQLLIRPTCKNIGRGMPYLHPTMVVRKSLFDKAGMFDKSFRIAMDYDWVVRIERHGAKGYYFNEEPVVKMDGRGKSAEQEYSAIKECIKSLKNNNYLNIKTVPGLITRVVFYFLRRFMILIGVGSLLGKLKRIKYS